MSKKEEIGWNILAVLIVAAFVWLCSLGGPVNFKLPGGLGPDKAEAAQVWTQMRLRQIEAISDRRAQKTCENGRIVVENSVVVRDCIIGQGGPCYHRTPARKYSAWCEATTLFSLPRWGNKSDTDYQLCTATMWYYLIKRDGRFYIRWYPVPKEMWKCEVVEDFPS